jgi:hypothetical protein
MLARLGDDGAVPGVSDEQDIAGLPLDDTPHGRHIVAERGQRAQGGDD